MTVKINPEEIIGSEFNPSESELFRAIPKSISETFGIIKNQSQERLVSRLMNKAQKPIRLN